MTFEYSAIPGLCAAELAEVERAVARYERDTGRALFRVWGEWRPPECRFFETAPLGDGWERIFGIEALAFGLIRRTDDLAIECWRVGTGDVTTRLTLKPRALIRGFFLPRTSLQLGSPPIS